jgi:putative copper resistance protein D
MEEALYTCRFVQFTSAIVIFGAVSFRYYAVAGNGGPANAIATFDAWVSQVALAAAVTALASALALLVCQTAMMAASSAAAIDPAALWAVLFDTRFGRVWSCHFLMALLLVLACLGRSRTLSPAILIPSLVLLASLAWIGHAAIAGIAHEFNQAVHLLAAGLWLGGLVPLGWLLRRARATRDAATIILARDAIRRFSQMGYVAVALIASTGAVNSMLLVGCPGAMLSTLTAGSSRSKSCSSWRWSSWRWSTVSALPRRFPPIQRRSERSAAPSAWSKVSGSRSSRWSAFSGPGLPPSTAAANDSRRANLVIAHRPIDRE